MLYAKDCTTHAQAVEEICALLTRKGDLEDQIRSLQSQLARTTARLPSLMARAEELAD